MRQSMSNLKAHMLMLTMALSGQACISTAALQELAYRLDGLMDKLLQFTIKTYYVTVETKEMTVKINALAEQHQAYMVAVHAMLQRLNRVMRQQLAKDRQGAGQSSGIKCETFTEEELIQATSNFHQDNLIGSGGFGMVWLLVCLLNCVRACFVYWYTRPVLHSQGHE
jgi:hypothetical protein